MAATCSSFWLNMMRMMMAAGSVSLLLLCSSIIAVTGSEECDLYAMTGRSFTVPLNYQLTDTDHLRWKHDNKLIYYRRGTANPNTKKEEIYKNGSLNLKNVNDTKKGVYSYEVYDSDGVSKKQGSLRLCVVDPVPKPTVKFSCESPSNVKFTCDVGKTQQDLRFQWTVDKVPSKTLNKNFMTKSPKEVENKAVSCSVSNRVESATSAEVRQNCTTSESDFFQKLFTDYIWYLVGGGAGIVVLLILIIILCCIRAKRRDRMQLKEEEELRLGWTTTENTHHHHHHHHPPDQPRHAHQQPAGHTGPRQHRSKQHHDQQRPRVPNNHPQPTPRRPAQAPRPPPDADDEQPPPLPQPRKKTPKTPRA